MPAPSTTRRLLPLALAEAGLALPALGLAWWFGLPIVEQLPTGGRLAAAVLRGVLATLPLVALLAWAMHTRWRPARRFRRLVERLIGDLVGDAPIGWLIAISAAAGIGEEFLFRGALQPLLVGWVGPWGGVVAASLLFGLAHPITRTYVVVATTIGLYLGALAYLSDEIVSAMVAHGLYDVAALVVLSRRSSIRRVTNGNGRCSQEPV